MTPDEATALYLSEKSASLERTAEQRAAHRARVARIVAQADTSNAVTGANGKRRGRGILIPRPDPRELLPHLLEPL